MNARERAFINAYCGKASGNATKAAIQAGYSARSAGQIGGRLMKKDEIARAIEARQSTAEDNSIATAEERDRIMTAIARKGRPIERIKAVNELNKVSGRHVTNTRLSDPNGNPLAFHVITGVPPAH